jgi:DNA-directed RNA polymerase specialized sigma24 family protein
MPEDTPFLDLIRRVRAGDDQASAELVRLYEPAIRIAVRVRLNDPGLRRLFDSMDICQSVLGSFFIRAALGQFELDKPDQLLKLLVTMARNRLTSHARQEQAARRDYRRTEPVRPGSGEIADPGPSPSDVVAGKELLQIFRGRLSEEENQLAEERALGKSWKEIAAERGGSPDGLRMQLGRAVDRVAQEMRLDA